MSVNSFVKTIALYECIMYVPVLVFCAVIRDIGSLKGHVIYSAVSLCIGLLTTAAVWAIRYRSVGLFVGAATSFVLSFIAANIASEIIMRPSGEASAWALMVLLPEVFLATIAGATVGVYRAAKRAKLYSIEKMT